MDKDSIHLEASGVVLAGEIAVHHLPLPETELRWNGEVALRPDGPGPQLRLAVTTFDADRPRRNGALGGADAPIAWFHVRSPGSVYVQVVGDPRESVSYRLEMRASPAPLFLLAPNQGDFD